MSAQPQELVPGRTYTYFLGRRAGTINTQCPRCREKVEVDVILQTTHLYAGVLEAHVHAAPVAHQCSAKDS